MAERPSNVAKAVLVRDVEYYGLAGGVAIYKFPAYDLNTKLDSSAPRNKHDYGNANLARRYVNQMISAEGPDSLCHLTETQINSFFKEQKEKNGRDSVKK